MRKYKYGILGHKWGLKIYNILKKKNKNCFLIELNYKDQNIKKYLKNLRYIINKNKIDIVWLAIPPINQFKICKAILLENANIIVEKPLIIKEKEKKYLNALSKRKLKKISVNFQYIFLKKLINFNYNLDFNFIEYIFRHSDKKRKLSSLIDLGSHLISIKNTYFMNCKYKIKTSFSLKDERKVIFKNDNDIVYVINFKSSKEKIIQKFIDYFENKVMKGVENKLSLNFGYNVTKQLNNISKNK